MAAKKKAPTKKRPAKKQGAKRISQVLRDAAKARAPAPPPEAPPIPPFPHLSPLHIAQRPRGVANGGLPLPGERFPGAGRKKGTMNKVPRQLKDMLIAALEKLGEEDYFVGKAHKYPKAFMTLIKGLLPHEITGPGGGPLQSETVTIDASKLTTGVIEALLKARTLDEEFANDESRISY